MFQTFLPIIQPCLTKTQPAPHLEKSGPCKPIFIFSSAWNKRFNLPLIYPHPPVASQTPHESDLFPWSGERQATRFELPNLDFKKLSNFRHLKRLKRCRVSGRPLEPNKVDPGNSFTNPMDWRPPCCNFCAKPLNLMTLLCLYPHHDQMFPGELFGWSILTPLKQSPQHQPLNQSFSPVRAAPLLPIRVLFPVESWRGLFKVWRQKPELCLLFWHL